MNRLMRTVMIGMVAGLAVPVMAQPTITSLGSGAPLSVTNNLGGTTYVGGSGLSTVAPARWTLTGSTLTATEVAGSGGGYLSRDNGTFLATGIVNGPTRFAIGNTATGVSPAFLAPGYAVPTLVASATLPAATEFGGARYSFASNSLTNMGTVGIIPFTPNPNAAPVTVSTITCSGSAATAVTAAPHGLAVNDVVFVTNNTVSAYNGTFFVTNVVDANTFQYSATCGLAGTGGQVVKQVVNIGNSGVFGPSSGGSSTSNFLSTNAISANGRFIVGLHYVCAYNTGSTAGTSISANTFYWRPVLWDAEANAGAGAMTVLPTPFKTASANVMSRRRTGNPFAVSNDGMVVVGAQEHNTSTLGNPDPDGARLVVWRFNPSTSTYNMTYLPNGVDANGFPYTVSQTVGSVLMNSTGTIIAGRAVDSAGNAYIAKWVWNAASSTWNAPISIGSNLSTPASWLPVSVTSCDANIPTPRPNLSPTGMSEDGNTIVGSAVYSTCGSFMSGGFIWTNADGVMQDWYDYNVALGTPDIVASYGPIGDGIDSTRGLPKLGYPTSISPNGNAIVGLQGGTQRIPGAVPWLFQNSGGAACTAPSITLNPASTQLFSRCSVGSTLSTVVLNASALGTLPLSYQWFKDGNMLNDGPTASGGVVTGATSFQMRITTPGLGDAGSYNCIVTGCNGASATTTSSIVAADPAVISPINDTCATALSVGEGTVNYNVCGAYVNDGYSSCSAPALADVWYVYTPTFTGNARFQTCASSFNTTLDLFDGCGGNPLACNDDVGSRGLVGTSCSSQRSLISSFAVTAGVPVYVRIGALGVPFTNALTTGALTISQAPNAPANDLCENAQVVGVGAFPFNLAEATDDYTFGVDTCGGGTQTASNRDVWFRLNAPCGGTFTFSTCGSTITNPMLHVMLECGGGLIACNDNVGSGVSGCTSNQARISDLAIQGSVLVRVSASGTGVPNSGAGILTITGTPIPCCNADFNHDGTVNPDDLADYIGAYFSVPPGAGSDFNQDGLTDPDDLADYIGVYFGGC